MKKKLTIVALVFILVASLGVVAYVFRGSLISRFNGLIKKEIDVTNMQAFPVGESIVTKSSDIVDSEYLPLQGTIAEYGVTDSGVSFMRVMYIIEGKEHFVNILMNIPETEIPADLNVNGTASDYVKSQFRKRYVDSVKIVLLSSPDSLKGHAIYMKVDEFKSIYKIGALLYIPLLKTYPNSSLMKDDFCKNHGYIVCGVAILANRYSGDMSKFWEDHSDDYSGILIPYEFNFNIKSN
ncbi:hypothetical protein M0R04_03765 [Candidatus Dojkabacteria bacterium]|jgi:hypothetical protein|nr:hypothetical protein [Candidatus Dojkabacteria bacterium]